MPLSRLSHMYPLTVCRILPVDQRTSNRFPIAFVDGNEGGEDAADSRLDTEVHHLLYFFSQLPVLPLLLLQGADESPSSQPVDC